MRESCQQQWMDDLVNVWTISRRSTSARDLPSFGSRFGAIARSLP
jgi:hypothetical protein